MKYPPRIAALAVVAVLSVAGLTAVTTALADSGNRSEWSKPGMGKHHGGKKMCNRHGGKHGMRGPDALAKKLSVMETEIGIRANQLDDWRDFTDALQATMKRPMMGMGRGGPGGPGPRMMAPDDNAEPFAMAERFADNTIERAQSAEALKAAIAKLRTTLTPEQLDKVKAIEARLRARMAEAHGWQRGPHGKGHHGMGPHGGGPNAGKPAPDAAPAAKPDTPGDDDDGEDNDDSL
jgi:hypothetical protein